MCPKMEGAAIFIPNLLIIDPKIGELQSFACMKILGPDWLFASKEGGGFFGGGI
jgi:hypothetical protein